MFGAPQFGADYFADGLLATTPPDYNPCGSFGFGGFYLGQRPNCADAVPAGDGITYIGWSGSSVDRHTAAGDETSSGGFWRNLLMWVKPPQKHHKEKSTGAMCLMGWSDEKLTHRHSEKSDTSIPQRSFVTPSRSERVHYKEASIGGLAMFALGVELARLENTQPTRQIHNKPHPTKPRRIIQPSKHDESKPRKQSRRRPILLQRMLPDSGVTIPETTQAKPNPAQRAKTPFENEDQETVPVNRIQAVAESEHDLMALLIALDEI
jgi:hypothetical protein